MRLCCETCSEIFYILRCEGNIHTSLTVNCHKIDKQTHINRSSKLSQKNIWKQILEAEVIRAAPEVCRSKIHGRRSGVRNIIRRAERHGKIKTNLPSFFLSNVNRIHNKIEELEALTATKHPKNCCAIVLTETWLTNNHLDTQLSRPGYPGPVQ